MKARIYSKLGATGQQRGCISAYAAAAARRDRRNYRCAWSALLALVGVMAWTVYVAEVMTR